MSHHEYGCAVARTISSVTGRPAAFVNHFLASSSLKPITRNLPEVVGFVQTDALAGV